MSGSVLENYKINSIYGIKNYSYIVKYQEAGEELELPILCLVWHTASVIMA